MSKLLLRSARPFATTRQLQSCTRRTLFDLPDLTTRPQSLTESRVLPYKASHLYKMIADVDSYRDFVPYCTTSRVTKWSKPDAEGKRWPSEAELKVGWGGVEEGFTSRLFCEPGRTVEAVSGDAKTTLPRSQIKHHGDTVDAPPISNAVFKNLTTTWTLKPFHYKPPKGNPQPGTNPGKIETEEARDRTEVFLNIEFTFTNPLYAAMSKAVAPKVTGVMIQAFENRAKMLLDGNGTGKEQLHDTFRPGKSEGNMTG